MKLSDLGFCLIYTVSEAVKRPLYHLQAGEIGSDPAAAKQSLKRAFRLCEEWDAILLLDGILSNLTEWRGSTDTV